ncbi:ribosome-associated translation inhibitor RaiA [Desulfovibrio subterraneus]|uniref:Ribosome hibernation promoting factor n=1 Tax=Desulfovibrio subterraneus TaxID=2718620 RepID=A0A7J0BJN6_9BACT|nr:ribosome-associated translation inhibitor RaiA [Desulfovibrio subterraneus]WBF67980.1 ribosome-associated translation inhibitor RaiA [Desulfovibrio subterraneus]GFM33849.1 ribose ABC transporter permease [Desulfovibrio subterraneus]
MNIAFTFKNFEPSDHLKKYARRRFEKLGKFLTAHGKSEMQVGMSVDNYRHKIDVTLVADGLNLSANEKSEDMYATVDLVFDKLASQVKKHSEKNKDHRRGAELALREDVFSYADTAAGRERTIVGTDHFTPKPMGIDEAALQLDSLNFEFLVFLNAETERVNVIYRRENGDFGLIDPTI